MGALKLIIELNPVPAIVFVTAKGYFPTRCVARISQNFGLFIIYLLFIYNVYANLM